MKNFNYTPNYRAKYNYNIDEKRRYEVTQNKINNGNFIFLAFLIGFIMLFCFVRRLLSFKLKNY